MDPNHRDRIAFVRLCSGTLRARHEADATCAPARRWRSHNPMIFFARDRELAEEAVAGDIVGIPNHGTLRVGDTLTEGATSRFTGMPDFAPGDPAPRAARRSDEGQADAPRRWRTSPRRA